MTMNVDIHINIDSVFQISDSKLAINIEMNINMHINIESGCRPRGFAPNPTPSAGPDFFRCHVINITKESPANPKPFHYT